MGIDGYINQGKRTVISYSIVNGNSKRATPTPVATILPSWIYDYNGDGLSDIAIFRGSSGLWAIRDVTRLYFGSASDTVVPGEFRVMGDPGYFQTLLRCSG